MNVELSTAIAIGTAIASLATAWATVRGATQRHEAALEKIGEAREGDLKLQREQAAQLEARVLERLKEYSKKRDEQGGRIGALADRVSKVEGRLMGLGSLPASEGRPRRSTGAIPIQTDEDPEA